MLARGNPCASEEKRDAKGAHRDKRAPAQQSLPSKFFFGSAGKTGKRRGEGEPSGARRAPPFHRGSGLLALRVSPRLVPLHHGPRRDFLGAPAVAARPLR